MARNHQELSFVNEAFFPQIYNHIALPPRLPGSEDPDQLGMDKTLVAMAVSAITFIKQHVAPPAASVYTDAIRSLDHWGHLNACASASQSTIASQISHLEEGQFMLFHMPKQNGTLILWKLRKTGSFEHLYRFEAFEASARTETVLKSELLQWDFPSDAIEISGDVFENAQFQARLAEFLHQISTESYAQCADTTTRAGTITIETRNTANPLLIFSFLVPLLHSIGAPSTVPKLRKHVRDEAVYSSGTPWRRSSLYLSLRVALQRHFAFQFGDVGRLHYKLVFAIMHANLLRSCYSWQTPELTLFLLKKTTRRMAKIEKEKLELTVDVSFNGPYQVVAQWVRRLVSHIDGGVQHAWMSFVRQRKRRVPLIPTAPAAKDIFMSLKISADYLKKVVTLASNEEAKALIGNRQLPSPLKEVSALYRLADIEDEVQVTIESESSPMHDLKTKIQMLFQSDHSKYENNPIKYSAWLLQLFSLWAKLDELVIDHYPEVGEYNAVFPPKMFDCLQLSTKEEMKQLQTLQLYLQLRQDEHHQCTIFADPFEDCFGDNMFNSYQGLSHILESIQKNTAIDKAKVLTEWRKKSEKYELYRNIVATTNCSTIVLQTDPVIERHLKDECDRCTADEESGRIRVRIYEKPLSDIEYVRNCTIFEVHPPKIVSEYRDITALFMTKICLNQPPRSGTCKLLLPDYSQLFEERRLDSKSVTLGSTTKSFLTSHYRTLSLPTDYESLFKNNPLKWRYFDPLSGYFLNDIKPGELSLARFCYTQIPPKSPLSLPSVKRNLNSMEPIPSSAAVLSQLGCPMTTNCHEFTAVHDLLVGHKIRWYSILIELFSSNISIGSEASLAVFNRLIHQAGPMSEDADSFRDIHVALKESRISKMILDYICRKLDAISRSYYENLTMELLLTLLYKVLVYSPSNGVREMATLVLSSIQEVSGSWMADLKQELRQNLQPEEREKLSQNALWASLLSRRCVLVMLSLKLSVRRSHVDQFTIASVMMQQNMITERKKCPNSLRQAIVWDIQMSYRLTDVLISHIVENSVDYLNGLKSVLPIAHESRFEGKVEQTKGHAWIACHVKDTSGSETQHISFDPLTGRAIVDNMAVGPLPADYFCEELLQIFGTNRFLVLPSQLRGMDYKLNYEENGSIVHLGKRESAVVLRIQQAGKIFELIPRRVFQKEQFKEADLPQSLIEDRFHIFDLQSRQLEIRTKQGLWNPDRNECVISLHKRSAVFRKKSYLIDPHSDYAKTITAVFAGFEDSWNILISFPIKEMKDDFRESKLSTKIDLPRYDLSLLVGNYGQIWSPQLAACIDSNQEIGCFTGLKSHIVLSANHGRQRSIIVPMGHVVVQKEGMHVSVKIRDSEEFARFKLDRCLRRLDNPPEMELTLLKALLFATTSSSIPDDLTFKTGTEMAIEILESAVCQPWDGNLSVKAREYLYNIALLSPLRDHYPEKSRSMETVTWNDTYPIFTQSNRLRVLAERITSVVDKLSLFTSSQDADTSPAYVLPKCDMQLLERSERRLQKYNRSKPFFPQLEEPAYTPRTGNEAQAQKVYRICSELRDISTLRFSTPPNIHIYLRPTAEVDGFVKQSENTNILVGDLLASNIPESWGYFVMQHCMIDSEERYKLLFQLGILAFRKDVPLYIVQVLLMYAMDPDLKAIARPTHPIYLDYRAYEDHDEGSLSLIVQRHIVPFEKWEFTARNKLKRYRAALTRELPLVTNYLLEAWITRTTPDFGAFEESEITCIDKQTLLDEISLKWPPLYHNKDLKVYLLAVEKLLSPLLDPSFAGRRFDSARLQKLLYMPHTKLKVPTLLENLDPPAKLLRTVHWPKLMPVLIFGFSKWKKGGHDNTAIDSVKSAIDHLSTSNSLIRNEYAQSLRQSYNALSEHEKEDKPSYSSEDVEKSCPSGLKQCEDQYRIYYDFLQQFVLLDRRAQNVWLQMGYLWSTCSPMDILKTASGKVNHLLHPLVKQAILEFGVAITNWQRFQRIQHMIDTNKMKRVEEEIENVGHTNWNPYEYPDWLLLEIDSQIMIRPRQVDVALEIISPMSESGNGVLQMNMGQGKTSVIIPMVACALADRKRVVRIIVPQSLLAQTSQILHDRLGKLVNREIKYLPFSRATKIDEKALSVYAQMHHKMMLEGGIMICLPEHIMSFKLCSIQNSFDGKSALSKHMVQFQAWLHRHARDVLDECDHTLAVRTQLIYTSGSHMTVPGHPVRWRIVQEILRLVLSHLPDLQAQYAGSIEVVRRKVGEFPFVMFLRRDAEEALISRLADDICSGRTGIIPAEVCNRSPDQEWKPFIVYGKVKAATFKAVDSFVKKNTALRDTVYLLRGLFVHRVLIFAFQKRWNVQYGIHPLRKPMSVPFQAKGVPSEQAEWGHPDVSIIFTCLTFYYSGLTRDQFVKCIQSIQSLDDPKTVYLSWVESCAHVPSQLKNWDSIHMEDTLLVDDLWKLMRYNLVVIDYFLNSSVFPVYAKQYEHKLAASSWDLVQTCIDPEIESLIENKSSMRPVTSGFSGTNDNRNLLPFTINQIDLPAIVHTNAEVLSYLLEERNSKVLEFDTTKDEVDFLKFLVSQRLTVLIDVGARILEMDNFQLARTWLDLYNDSSPGSDKPRSIVYFHRDIPYVLTKGRRRGVPLLSSRYIDNLENCLVYLDQAHTRGTDLPLYANSKGALTLGLDLTKDQVTQAAMRLRQLATTQKICFISPTEVTNSIKDKVMRRSRDRTITSIHVVKWLLEQTCDGLESLQSLYYFQGMDFCARLESMIENKGFVGDAKKLENYRASLLQKEPISLRELYDPRKSQVRKEIETRNLNLSKIISDLQHRRKKMEDNGKLIHGSMLQEVEVEQENEVQAQVETVQEIQSASLEKVRIFTGLSDDLLDFLETGTVSRGSRSIIPVFSELQRLFPTRLIDGNAKAHTVLDGNKRDSYSGSHKLYCSFEFFRILKSDQYFTTCLRSARWILWCQKTEIAILLIPEEAEAILSILRQIGRPVVNLLTFAPLTSLEQVSHFGNLDFYSIPELPKNWEAPPWLLVELILVSGSIYFAWPVYQDLVQFLQLEPNKLGTGSSNNGALQPSDASVTNRLSQLTFSRGPTAENNHKGLKAHLPMRPQFLLTLLSILRKGQDISYSPISYLIHRRPVNAGFHFFRQLVPVGEQSMATIKRLQAIGGVESRQYRSKRSGNDGHVLVEDSGDDSDSDVELAEIKQGEGEVSAAAAAAEEDKTEKGSASAASSLAATTKRNLKRKSPMAVPGIGDLDSMGKEQIWERELGSAKAFSFN